MSNQSVTSRSLGSAMERLAGNWGWFVAFGIVLCAFGLFAIAYVVTATIASVLFIGVMLIITGAGEIALGVRARDWSRFFLWIIGGILYILIGSIAIWQPVVASLAFTLLLGAGLIAAGVVRLVLAFQLPAEKPRGLVILGAVVTLLLGVYIVVLLPAASLIVLGTLLGVDLIFHGAGWLMLGLALRRRHLT